MKDKSLLSGIGVILFFFLTAIDKFYLKLPIYVYLPLGIVSLVLIIIGFKKDSKKVLKKDQLKIIIVTTLITLLLILIYLNPFIVYNNYKLVTYIKSNLNETELTNLIPFSYDKAYIAYPYTSKEDIEKELGIKSRFIKSNDINDNIQEIIVIKNKQVIAATFISSVNDKFRIQTLPEDNIIENDTNKLFYLKNINNISAIIETYRTKEETFNNINFKVSGLWWQEDKETLPRVYYFNEEKIDNLTIDLKENFNYKKYKKSLKGKIIIETKLNTKSISNIKYLEIKVDNSITEVHYIFSLNKETYIFKLSTQNKNISKNNNESLEVIDSITFNTK